MPLSLNEKLFTRILEMEKAEKKSLEASSMVALKGSALFQEKLELCLVSFPEKKALGTATVEGAFLVEATNQAPSGRSHVVPHVVGNSDKDVARWINDPLGERKGNRP
jgi:hypothetical protein